MPARTAVSVAIRAALVGVAGAAAAYLLELAARRVLPPGWGVVLAIAVIEEGAKFTALRAAGRASAGWERVALAALMVALGFALVENMIYLRPILARNSGLVLALAILGRLMLPLVLHVTCAMLLAAGMLLPAVPMAAGVAAAVLCHFAYDAALLLPQAGPDLGLAAQVVLSGWAVAAGVLALARRAALRRAR